MVNKAAIGAVQADRQAKRHEQELLDRVQHKRVEFYQLDEKKEHTIPLHMTIITKDDLHLPLYLHDWDENSKKLKPALNCARMQYPRLNGKCQPCTGENSYGEPNKPSLCMCMLVFVHDYYGKCKQNEDGTKGQLWDPIRVAAFPPGRDGKYHELLKTMQTMGDVRKNVLYVHKSQTEGLIIKVFPKEEYESLPTKGVIPKEYREIIKGFDEDYHVQHTLNVFQGVDFTHWGVTRPEVKPRKKQNENSRPSYQDEDNKPAAKAPEQKAADPAPVETLAPKPQKESAPPAASWETEDDDIFSESEGGSSDEGGSDDDDVFGDD